MTPRQLPLPRLADPRYTRPLCTISTAKGLLDLTEDEISALVDEGQLVAFDISLVLAPRDQARRHRELRILTASIAEFLRDNPDYSPCFTSQICPDIAVKTVLAAIKHEKPYLTGTEIKRLLNCGRQHVINLVQRKVLPLMPGTTYRPGPKGYPLIPRPAFLAFLTARLEGSI